VDARVFPLFRIDPRDPALTHELEGNPAPEEIWFRRENGDAVTPAHWALGEGRYAREFGPVDEEKGEPIPFAEYLELPSEARAGKIPVVMDAQGARFAVGEALANAAGERHRTWLLLRARGAPPAPVERPASPDAIEEALASVRASYESRIADLRLDLARQVRGRLLTLLARRTGGNGEGEETR
jgi:pyruvate-ferredoxin/flavodoxin oxidoreductase